MAMILTGLLCGFVFGWGLLISGMMNPVKVLGFLDIFGAWDPSLAVVMGAALIVSCAGFMLAAHDQRPVLTPQAQWPMTTAIDRPLIAGSAMFGVGWGLVGLCPGPALENLATLSPQVIVFVAAMGGGMWVHDLWQKRHASAKRTPATMASVDG